jgi:hypothetical protein
LLLLAAVKLNVAVECFMLSMCCVIEWLGYISKVMLQVRAWV